MVKKIKSNEFDTSVAEGISVVDFSAEWCGPCKMMAPVFDELSGEMSGINFIKVDVDECPDIAQKFLVTGVPTLIVMKDGKEVDRQVGFVPKNVLSDFLAKHS